jgi:O-acetyl-ADP-ribose deacetylase (regulator of RNase III)
MKEIKGDLIELAYEGNFNAIVHGCNCFCTMGGGIAKTIKNDFPEAYAADCKTRKGDMMKLGTFTFAHAEGQPEDIKFDIVNAYTQYNYGTDDRKADYEAIRLVMRKINHFYKGDRIGLPKIGAGLAGGDWTIISKIIEEELKDCDVTIVEYDKQGLW